MKLLVFQVPFYWQLMKACKSPPNSLLFSLIMPECDTYCSYPYLDLNDSMHTWPACKSKFHGICSYTKDSVVIFYTTGKKTTTTPKVTKEKKTPKTWVLYHRNEFKENLKKIEMKKSVKKMMTWTQLTRYLIPSHHFFLNFQKYSFCKIFEKQEDNCYWFTKRYGNFQLVRLIHIYLQIHIFKNLLL